MRFSSDKGGTRLVAAQCFLIGLIPLAFCAYFYIVIGTALIAIWAVLCVIMLVRLNSLRVLSDKNILSVYKGRFFPVALRVPLRYITGVHILQTPIARRMQVCAVIVYTSGLSFLLLGVKYSDAANLAAIASRGGTRQ